MFRTTVLLCLVAALALAAPALAAEGERWARVGTLAHANNAFEALVAAHHGHDEAAFARAQREELALRAAMGRVQQTAHELQASAVLGADGVDAATWAHVQDRLRTMFGEESVRPHRVGVTLVFAEARDTHKVEEVMQWAEVSAVAPWLAAHKLSSIFESHKEQICTDMFTRQDRSVELSVTTNPMSVAEVMTFTEELQRNLKSGTVQNDFDRLPASVREGPNAGVRRQRVVRIEVPNCATAGDVAKDAIQHRAGFWVEPRATVRTSNKWAAGVTQDADIDSHTVWNSALNGTGQIVGVADSGLDASHCFFYDPDVATPYNTISTTHRKIVTYIPFVDDGDYEGGHGSHVSGSVLGQVYDDGNSANVAEFNGMAFGAKISFFDIGDDGEFLSLPSDLETGLYEPLRDTGAFILTNSWGSIANRYDVQAASTDQFMWDHPDSLVLFAAGNSGDRGSNTVGTPATAKSIASVGCTLNAAESWESFQDNVDTDKYNFDNVAYFSSQGPTRDGRIKPDVMAPGYYTTSTNAQAGTGNSYHCDTLRMAGTSMATPTTAGDAALIREYFTSGFYPSGSANAADAFVPSGALLKNMLVQSAVGMNALLTQREEVEPLGTPPDNIQGYGRIELDNVLRVADSDFSLLAIGAADASSGGSYYEFTAAGQSDTFTIKTGSSLSQDPLKATVTWTDYPSSTAFRGGGEMVNVLGLTVESDSDEYVVKNVENPIVQVVIDNPEPNAEYTIKVEATTILQGPQPYSLVVTGDFTA